MSRIRFLILATCLIFGLGILGLGWRDSVQTTSELRQSRESMQLVLDEIAADQLVINHQIDTIKADIASWPDPEPTIPLSRSTEAPFRELVRYKITAYCACCKCCGKSDGITASGAKVKQGVTVAGSLPFGTVVWIEGVGQRIVQDRGTSGKHLDLYFESHQEALNWGVQYRDVEVLGK